MDEFEIIAEPRTELGKAAMRRIRRNGLLPGIVYGADKEPQPIVVTENTLRKQMENEAFFSHILTLKVTGQGSQQTVVKALQRHPATSRVTHVDLLRVSATQKLTLVVPLHFNGEEDCPGVEQGGVVSHQITEVEIECLPGDLPEFISVDASTLELGDSVHLSQLVMPSGVELTALTEDNDPTVLSVALPRAEEEPEEDEEGAEGEADEAGDAPEASDEDRSEED